MRAQRSFVVRSRLPEELEGLSELATNLRWTWDRRTQDLFRRLDPEEWELGTRDPLRLLRNLGREGLERVAGDAGFRELLAGVREELAEALGSGGWYEGRGADGAGTIAYFSPEFGLTEAVPQYSGGLGVLAGDHLKAASDLGVPLCAIGLLYRHGYFRQELDGAGWQREWYPTLDPEALALRSTNSRVEVPVGSSRLVARVWRADVGRVPLYLLDADLPENPPELRDVTDRLYGGGAEHRIRQEILLGMGGVRALAALRIEPEVLHTNEGHAGFLMLERIRRLVGEGIAFGEAVEAVRAETVFTTHTSVPAGIDRFPRELMERYFSGWAAECGIGFDAFMELGHEPGTPPGEAFNMAVMALRLASTANGVSLLHEKVTRRLFGGVWPHVPAEEVPITSITNGVHARTWVSEEMDDLFERIVGSGWPERDAAAWERVAGLDPAELWKARTVARERLVRFVRRRLYASARARGESEWDAAWCEEALSPDMLTIGFARRFAGYKRGTLLLLRPDRLRALLTDSQHPVQFVFSGKAHPADDAGKEMIRRITEFARHPGLRDRFVFLEDYDIATARALAQGCDVWLNTPRRPHEACGTSGMKAALNGGLNCSVLDGWWDEWFDGDNGWAIRSVEIEPEEARRDEMEADGLFDLLERRIAPAFYERDPRGVPLGWMEMVRSSLVSLGPRVGATRMVREYVERLYDPAAVRAQRLRADRFGRARALAAWKERVVSSWKQVRIRVEDVGGGAQPIDLGDKRAAEAIVELGDLTPEDVEVELIHGPVVDGNVLEPAGRTTMEVAGAASGGHRFRGSFAPERAGRYGFTVRVVPAHPDLASPTELGLMAWP